MIGYRLCVLPFFLLTVSCGGGGSGSSAEATQMVSASSSSSSSTDTGSNDTTSQQSDPSNTGIAWSAVARDRWRWSDLEANTDYCSSPSIRWGAISGFDINSDGKNDVLLAISCYQEFVEPTQKHNTQVLPAWRIFCSDQNSKSHYDCTAEKFGSNEINAAGMDNGGGNPYLHVMETPRDVNGDGFPDFWYVLNRDDGRPGFEYNDDQADADLLQAFCGDKPPAGQSWDCTRRSDQSMLISNTNGSYEIKKLPWSEVNAQGLIMLKIDESSFDLLSFNYEGRTLAARYIGGEFQDVSTEYESYVNESIKEGQPYVHSFFHEGINYLVTPNVATEVAGYEPSYAHSMHTGLRPGEHLGFTLWRFSPGIGFEVSDFHIPNEDSIFTVQIEDGSKTVEAVGTKILDIPVVWPNWHFFNFTNLSPNEDSILVIRQEPDGGINMGEAFKAPIQSDVIYTNDPNQNQTGKTLAETLFLMAGPVEAFYIREGKLERREKSVIEGDVGWNIPGMKFQDLNGDEFVDMVAITGGEQRGSIFLNDGEGTLHKVDMMSSWPEIDFLDVPAEEFSYGALATQLDDDQKLDLMIWVEGGTRKWWGDNRDWNPGDVYILEGNFELKDFGITSSQKIHELVESCFLSTTSYFKKSQCVW